MGRTGAASSEKTPRTSHCCLTQFKSQLVFSKVQMCAWTQPIIGGTTPSPILSPSIAACFQHVLSTVLKNPNCLGVRKNKHMHLKS